MAALRALIRLGLWIALAAAPAAGAQDPSVVVRLRGASAPATAVESVVVSVEEDGGASVERRLAGSPQVRIELEWGEHVLVSCEGPGIWCPTLVVFPSENVRELELPVYRSVALAGRLRFPALEEPPGEVLVQGWLRRSEEASEPSGLSLPALASLTREGGPILVVRVQLEDGTLQLEGPDAPLDLRLAADGFSPWYRWDVQARAGRLDLGEIRLARGGSVSGFVWNTKNDLPAAGAWTRLIPAGIERLEPAAKERLERTLPLVTASEHGFFQHRGLQAGIYRLEAGAEGLATIRLEGVEVQDDAESFLEDTLLLHPPIRLAVRVLPARDPGGRPWSLELDSVPPGPVPLETTTDEAGEAELPGLQEGRYHLLLLTSSESLAARRDVELNGSQELEIEVPLVAVRGFVHQGEEPIVARVSLQTGVGDQWEFATDEEGIFTGRMRRPERVLFAHITAEDPPIATRLALEDLSVEDGLLVLDLELSDRELRGWVRDHHDQPVAGALVEATASKRSAHTSAPVRVETRDDGSFSILGLSETSYLLQANDIQLGVSEVVEVDLSRPFPPEVELVLAPRGTRSGRIFGPSGEPIAGAKVEALVWQPVPMAEVTDSDLSGHFEIDLPEGSRRALVRMFAPAGNLWMSCVELGEEELVLRLPPGSGHLEIQTRADAARSPLLDGQVVVVERGGGFVTESTLLGWLTMTGSGSPFSAKRPLEDGSSLVRYPRIAPGEYALLWSRESSWSLARQLCESGPPPGLEWQGLSPGGSIRLELDLTPHQRRPEHER